jgi:hypothetical protein
MLKQEDVLLGWREKMLCKPWGCALLARDDADWLDGPTTSQVKGDFSNNAKMRRYVEGLCTMKMGSTAGLKCCRAVKVDI